MMNYHNQILSELGERLGLSLFFNENGQCHLLLEKFLIASIKSQESGWLFIGQHDFASKETAFWKDLLDFNLMLAKNRLELSAMSQNMTYFFIYTACQKKQSRPTATYSFLENYFKEL